MIRRREITDRDLAGHVDLYHEFNLRASGQLYADGVSDDRGKLTAAITRAGKSGVLTEGNYLVGGNYEIPSGFTLVPRPGAILHVPAGATLTVSGRVEAGRRQWLNVAEGGQVVFSRNAAESVFPEWVADDNTTEWRRALQLLVDATWVSGIPISLLPIDYAVSGTITLPTGVDLGPGHNHPIYGTVALHGAKGPTCYGTERGTRILQLATNGSHLFHADGQGYWGGPVYTFSDLTLIGPDTAILASEGSPTSGDAIRIDGHDGAMVARVHFNNLVIRRFRGGTGLYLDGPENSDLRNVHVYDCFEGCRVLGAFNNNDLTNVTFQDNDTGLILASTEGCSFTSCMVQLNRGTGLYISSSLGAQFKTLWSENNNAAARAGCNSIILRPANGLSIQHIHFLGLTNNTGDVVLDGVEGLGPVDTKFIGGYAAATNIRITNEHVIDTEVDGYCLSSYVIGTGTNTRILETRGTSQGIDPTYFDASSEINGSTVILRHSMARIETVNRVIVTPAKWTTAGTTQSVRLCTLPRGARAKFYLYAPEAFNGIGTAHLSLGTSSGGSEVLLPWDVSPGLANPNYGYLASHLGATLAARGQGELYTGYTSVLPIWLTLTGTTNLGNGSVTNLTTGTVYVLIAMCPLFSTEML